MVCSARTHNTEHPTVETWGKTMPPESYLVCCAHYSGYSILAQVIQKPWRTFSKLLLVSFSFTMISPRPSERFGKISQTQSQLQHRLTATFMKIYRPLLNPTPKFVKRATNYTSKLLYPHIIIVAIGHDGQSPCPYLRLPASAGLANHDMLKESGCAIQRTGNMMLMQEGCAEGCAEGWEGAVEMGQYGEGAQGRWRVGRNEIFSERV